MNKRIKELIEETVKTTLLEHSTSFVNVSIEGETINKTVVSIPTEFCEKLSELIIRDCIEQVKLELGNRGLLLSNPPQNAGVWDACNNIRRHFGIK